jgi:hypothetical protein
MHRFFRHLILLTLIASITICQAQENKPLSRIRLSDLYFQTGLSGSVNQSESINSLNVLTPESEILQSFAGSNSTSNSYSYGGNSFSSIQLGLSFRNKSRSDYKTNPLLRIGIMHISNNSISASSDAETSQPFDTLTSSQTNQVVYVDSITNRNYAIDYSSEQIRIDASLLFRSNQAARWSVMAGIGASYGVSINANTRVSYSKYGNGELTFSDGEKVSIYGEESEFRSETFNNKMNSGYSIYVPLGVDFKIGKKREFWKHAHLFFELRPGINIHSIPELKTYRTVNVQQGIGLRVSL